MTPAAPSIPSRRKSSADRSGNVFRGGAGGGPGRSGGQRGRGVRVGNFPAAAWVLVLLLLGAAGASAQTNFATLADDGAWTWFNDPRALFHNGILYYGYVRQGDGRSALSAFNLKTGAVTNLWTSRLGETDDFGSPALLARQDGNMVALYARRGSDQFFSYRLTSSTNPATPADWGPELRNWTGVTVASGMNYSSPFQLTAEDGRVYNFARYLNYNPCVFTSGDGGATWSRPVILIKAGNGSTRPYVKYCSDHTRRIDMFYTDGHPREVVPAILASIGAGSRRAAGKRAAAS